MFVLIDNYDSFTWNLYQAMARCLQGYRQDGTTISDYQDPPKGLLVVRNDKITIEETLALQPHGIVISPGPGRPEDAGISLELPTAILEGNSTTAMLGVCLGMQCIAQSFGAKVVRAKELMHGKTSRINHIGDCPLFEGIPKSFMATRYHSLVVDSNSIPEVLQVNAYSEAKKDHREKTIMALSHKKLDLFGVQFHPESIACEHGAKIIDNFINFCLKR